MIWLVRHGESELNAAGIRHRREDTPLTWRGFAQASAVEIPSRNFRVLTSPLRRARVTAHIIAERHGRPEPMVCEELIERDWDQDCEVAAKPAADLLESLDGDFVVVTHAGILKGLTGMTTTPPNCEVILWP